MRGEDSVAGTVGPSSASSSSMLGVVALPGDGKSRLATGVPPCELRRR